jgi:hypothetical protein
MEKTGFLEESPGNRSAMRLMCMTALISAIVFGSLTIIRSASITTRDSTGKVIITPAPRDDTGLTITFGFLLSAFAPKALQKFAEQKLPTITSGPQTYYIQQPFAVPTSTTAVVQPINTVPGSIAPLVPQSFVEPTASTQDHLALLQIRGR